MRTIITITIDHANLSEELRKRFTELVGETTLTQSHNAAEWGRAWTALRDAVDSSPTDAVVLTTERGWVAGWNIPGHLPDDEPYTFQTFHEAKASLLDELERGMQDRLSSCATEDAADRVRTMYESAMRATVQQAEAAGEFWVPCGKYVWWVAREA